MQNKGAIRLLIYTLIIVSIYQLSFTFVTMKIKSDAKNYGKGDYTKETQYLDSMQNQKVFNLLVKNFTLKECQDRQINLGLDLQGGMNIMLQVNVPSLIKELSNNSTDPNFTKAFNEALVDYNSNKGDFIDLLQTKYEKLVPNNDHSLASIFANAPQLRGVVDYNKTNDQVIAILKEQSKSAIDNIFNVLRTRIDRFGVTQPNIQQIEGKRGRILVELPGVKDEKRVQKLLEQSAALDFYLTYEATEIWQILQKADQKAADIIATQQYTPNNDTTKIQGDTTKLADTSATLLGQVDTSKNPLDTTQQNLTADENIKKHPILGRIYPAMDQNKNIVPGPLVGFVQVKDTAELNKILNMPQVKAMLPKDLILAWSVKPSQRFQNGSIYELIALKTTPQGGSQLGGDVIVNSTHNFDANKGSAEVSMTMSPSAAQKWAELTGNNIGKSIAIVLDGQVYSYPTVQAKITGGVSQITGDYSIEEAQDLANVLKSGKLPIKIDVVELNHVGPSLGKESIHDSAVAFIAAFIVILLYMLFYYRKAGWVASIALLANILFIFGVLASLGAVLTLPGIAGLILTIGTAVDANVIINERVFEEIKAGKSIKKAVSDGYSNSYSAIIDANVTTLITGIILYIFGHGPIQGFATTLIIGILTSLFTAIFITRIIFERMLDKNKEITFFSKATQNFLTSTKIDFIKMRKFAYILSLALIVLSIISIIIRGFDLGVDFVGGRTYVIRFDNNVNTLKLAGSLEKEFGSRPEVKTYGNDKQVRITTKYKIQENSASIDDEIKHKFYNALSPYFKTQVTYEQFVQDKILSQQVVGPTIAKDIKKSAAYAVAFALLAIFIYILIRFNKWQYSMGGVVALFHDSFITIGMFSMFWGILPFSLEVDQTFIAAILTIIGYSINDTVIIFDRIREYMNLHPKHSITQNMNDAINLTLRRTVNTSMTVLFTLLILLIFGGTVIRGFVFAMSVGIIIGTYSSVFVATPLAYEAMRKKEDARLALEATNNTSVNK